MKVKGENDSTKLPTSIYPSVSWDMHIMHTDTIILFLNEKKRLTTNIGGEKKKKKTK